MNYLELPNEQRRYTPFGILQNPDHVWPQKPSGVVRSLDVLKFGWLVGFGWSITAENASYIPSLALGIGVNNRFLSGQEDFHKEKIELSSDYHSKNIIRQKWFYHGLAFSASFSLLDSNTIACQIRVANEDHCPHTICIYGISELLYRGKSIIVKTASQEREIHLQFQGKDQYHRKPTFALISEKKPARALLSASREEIRRAIGGESTENQGEMERRHYAAGILEFRLDLMRQSEDSFVIFLCRSYSPSRAFKIGVCIDQYQKAMQAKIKEDSEFWKKSSLITGDWPENWTNGFIYDLETLRMMVSPPRGVFRHKWDIMQVSWPRQVMAETSLDMYLLSYADSSLAREVISGLFTDASRANVPCRHADGTFNMTADDGSRCGTSPAWCLPFYHYLLIYERTGNLHWIRKMYPLWKSFIKWWVENRSDSDGYLHYKCSWESGEDNAARFGIARPGGGQLIENIRAVELQAVIAQAAKSMKYYAELIGAGGDIDLWTRMEREYILRLRDLWHDQWFHDYDTSQKSFTPYTDPLHLTPIIFDLVNENEYRDFLSHPEELLAKFKVSTGVNALDWPSLTLPFLAAISKAGEKIEDLRNYLASKVFALISMIYSWEDSPELSLAKPLPGVSYERWKWPQMDSPVTEGYGWGAFSIDMILRYLIGFREMPFSNGKEFRLYPNLPGELVSLVQGGALCVKNLRFRDLLFDVQYSLSDRKRLDTTIEVSSNNSFKELWVTDACQNTVFKMSLASGKNSIKIKLDNGRPYTFHFQQH